MKAKGIVYLIGAGPGDPGLLTLRAKQLLERADVVVYDYLANPEILAFAAPAAEKIYVGKQAGKHSLKQADITRLLLKLARAGKKVARLKGGDPFVFGRGGEEAAALSRAGLAFEVVPGVTSGIAALSYAGIPLTDRALASCAVFATGHETPEKPESMLDYSALARLGGTLVFFMGVENAGRICGRLLQAGLAPATPAALVQWGTHPRQRTLVSRLDCLESDMKKARLAPPALLVVGKVVSLKPVLDWFETRPLFGRRIVVTRAREQASGLAQQLSELGAEVIVSSSIRVEPIRPNAALHASFARLPQTDWLIFTSANGVQFYFEALAAKGGDARSLAGVKVAAIGPATAQALAGYGVRADLQPSEAVAESLGRALKKSGRGMAGQKVVLARAREGRDILPRELAKAGAEVLDLPLYETLPVAGAHRDLAARFRAGEIDLVTFTSTSTLDFFLKGFSKSQLKSLLPGLKAASIGPITSQAARRAGIRSLIQAKSASVDGLVEAIVSNFNPTSPRLRRVTTLLR